MYTFLYLYLPIFDRQNELVKRAVSKALQHIYSRSVLLIATISLQYCENIMFWYSLQPVYVIHVGGRAKEKNFELGGGPRKNFLSWGEGLGNFF